MFPGGHLLGFPLKLRIFPSSLSCRPFPGFSQVMFTQPAGPVDRFGPTMKILGVPTCSSRQPNPSRIKPHQAASSRIKPHQAASSRIKPPSCSKS